MQTWTTSQAQAGRFIALIASVLIMIVLVAVLAIANLGIGFESPGATRLLPPAAIGQADR